jgi:disulfide bond formation protein DsbB
MIRISLRTINLFCLAVVVLLLGIVEYLQKFKGIDPCPLCILQRFALIGLGIPFLLGSLIPFKKIGLVINSLIALLFAVIGTLLASRQVWLQHLPPNQSSDCGASLDYMLQVLPWHEVLKKVLQGTSECANVGWEFLHVSLAGWSLFAFGMFTVIALWQLTQSFKKR